MSELFVACVTCTHVLKLGWLSGLMVGVLKGYKTVISPLLPNACRFLPTCSEYAIEAVKEFGPGRGAVLTAWRLLRCNPTGGSGYDPPRWPPVAYRAGE